MAVYSNLLRTSRFDEEGNSTHASYSYSAAEQRQAAITEAYQSVSSDPEIQEKIKANTLAQGRDFVLALAVIKRRSQFRAIKSAQGAAGGSSLSPGYKYSFSGADAKAWAYYPAKGQQLVQEREALMSRLKEAERKLILAENDEPIENTFDSSVANMDGYDDLQYEVQSLQDQINSLPTITDDGWVQLNSLATLSLNIHEPRAQVRALGHKGIKGFAGSVRTIAGTMIFTIVEGHPLRDLMLIDDEIGSKPSHRAPWSIDHYMAGRGTAYQHEDKVSKLATMLTPFNMHITYKSEYLPDNPSFYTAGGMGAALGISGIQIISEGIVTSVNDIVTEITYQFIAEDAQEFTGQVYAELVNEAPINDLQDSSTEELLAMLGTNYDDLITSANFSSSYQEIADQVMLEEINNQLGNSPISEQDYQRLKEGN